MVEKFTDQELQIRVKKLQNEQDKRQNAVYEEENKQLEEHQKLIVKHIDVLLEFTPKHNQSKCSDKEPYNSSIYDGNDKHCHRCTLLEIKNTNWQNSIALEINTYREEATKITPVK